MGRRNASFWETTEQQDVSATMIQIFAIIILESIKMGFWACGIKMLRKFMDAIPINAHPSLGFRTQRNKEERSPAVHNKGECLHSVWHQVMASEK